jgi:hypothetical protein
MSQSPNPLDKQSISRIGIAGAALGTLAVALFAGLWFGLGMTNLDVFPRLVIAICLPPAIMAALLGGYILVRRPSGGDR